MHPAVQTPASGSSTPALPSAPPLRADGWLSTHAPWLRRAPTLRPALLPGLANSCRRRSARPDWRTAANAAGPPPASWSVAGTVDFLPQRHGRQQMLAIVMAMTAAVSTRFRFERRTFLSHRGGQAFEHVLQYGIAAYAQITIAQLRLRMPVPQVKSTA